MGGAGGLPHAVKQPRLYHVKQPRLYQSGAVLAPGATGGRFSTFEQVYFCVKRFFSGGQRWGEGRRRLLSEVAMCATLGRSQDVCHGSRFTVEGERA